MNNRNERFEKMEQDMAAMKQRLARAERDVTRMQSRLRATWSLAFLGTLGAFVLGLNPEARAQFGVTLTSLNTRLTAVEAKTQFVSVSGNEMYITNANLNIRSGSGSTQGAVNGRGNLIIGYNEVSGSAGDERGGSHNLILGNFHDYTSYCGMAAGQSHRITGQFASVSGGQSNMASGSYASVSGGYINLASGDYTSVSGGRGNLASGYGSSVSGGEGNAASGAYAAVSGGGSNLASAGYTSVSGGVSNTVGAYGASMSGGFGREVVPFINGPDFTYTWRAGTLSAGR